MGSDIVLSKYIFKGKKKTTAVFIFERIMAMSFFQRQEPTLKGINLIFDLNVKMKHKEIYIILISDF